MQLLEGIVVAYRKARQVTRNHYNAGMASKADLIRIGTQLKTTQAGHGRTFFDVVLKTDRV